MKNLILLLFVFSLFSCASAQDVEQLPIYKINGTVSEIIGDRAIVSAGRYFNLNVGVEIPVKEGQPREFLQKGEDRIFWVEIVDATKQNTRKAVIVKSIKTCLQIQKEGEKVADDLSNRTIIRKST